MAQKAIREVFAKKLLVGFLKNNNFPISNYQGQAINPKNFKKIKLPEFNKGYVVKPDELFGKRGKNNLIFITNERKQAKDWIAERIGKEATIEQNGRITKGVLNNFLLEPFVPHEQEYYLALKTTRENDLLYISTQGGIDIEENWDQVTEIAIPFSLTQYQLEQSIKDEIQRVYGTAGLADFAEQVYLAFKKLNFSYLEFNPFTLSQNNIVLLDVVARLDDTAWYKSGNDWLLGGELEFPAPFGGNISDAEKQAAQLDAKSGASLKYSVLNPNGRIWMLTSGGGGSVVLADTVGDLGQSDQLGNYSDLSGNPTTDESQALSEIIFSEMLKSKAKNKVLIIAGGIANFTDIKNTFTGVVYAIRNYAEKMRKQRVKVYVRRGGPNYKEGLAFIESELKSQRIACEVYGPEMYMTEIIKLALK